MRKLSVIAVLLSMASVTFAGAVIDEDFNSGDFVSSSTRVSYDYDADADGTVDPFGNWVLYRDGSPSGAVNGQGTVQVDVPEDWFGSINPTGHNIGGDSVEADTLWTSTDGNISSFYQKYNDVATGGWVLDTELTAEMGGARNANGDALAFTLVYDAELNWQRHDRASASGVDARLVLDGTNYDADSPRFYHADLILANGWTYTPEAGDVDTSQAALATVLNTEDATSPWRIPGVTTGLIEQTVANGAAIQMQINNRRSSGNNWRSDSGGEWIYMSPGADNVKVYALEAGDVDANLVIDSFDIQGILAAAKFGTGAAGTWVDGDFTGDQLVDSFDIQAILANGLFGTGAYGAGSPAVPGDGVMDLMVNPDGTAVLSTDGLEVNGFILQAPGLLTGAATLPGSVFPQNTADIAAANILFVNLNGEADLGSLVADVAAFEAALENVLFTYTVEGATGTFEGTITVVPEPMTMGLLALGGLAVLRRRRK